MPRFACQRDANEMPIFKALQVAGREPIRLRDVDILAVHTAGYGVMLEVKVRKGKLQEIQKTWQRLFPGRYFVVRTVDQALVACGVSL